MLSSPFDMFIALDGYGLNGFEGFGGIARLRCNPAAGDYDIAIEFYDGLSGGHATQINPSGGPLCGHPVMATGLTRGIEVARRIRTGEAGRGLAHAASGAALQHNLLCILEGDA